ncbi:MAG: phospholipase [Actinomycetota bacterium]|nr:phospholipase [Actinomycetota bacterium]MDQ3647867.1 phospholipase [Actinomycetota bacterium]
MHGRAADEDDLSPFFDRLDPDRRLLGLAPRGPLSLPPGGAHWYSVARVGYPDPGTFHETLPRLTDWLDGALAEHGLDQSRTVLGGFSQGAVMSYAVGLGEGRPTPAAIVAMSGFMPTVEGFALDLTGREGLRVAIAHGTHDPVIGVEWGRDARARLTQAGADLLYREYPMAHSVDPSFLTEARGLASP